MRNMNVRSSAIATVLAVVLMGPLAVSAQSAAGTYKAKCAGCHGADGKGNTAPGKALGVHDFSSAGVTKMSDTDLMTIVSSGKNKMPAYGESLKDTEIKDMVAYVRELGQRK
jgi:mono/diheme cytochrome c family protein